MSARRADKRIKKEKMESWKRNVLARRSGATGEIIRVRALQDMLSVD